MAFSFCLPAFAEDTTAGGGIGDILGGITLPDVDIGGAVDTIKQLVGIIINRNGKMDEAVIAEIITILGKLANSGKVTPEILLKILNALTKGGNSGGNTPKPDAPAGGSVRSALDSLTNDQRSYIADVIESYLLSDFDNNPYMPDDEGNPTAYNPAKVTALINAMSRMDYADIQKVLDELHSSKNAKGEDITPALTDEAYGVLTAEVVRQEEVSKNNAATAGPTEATTSAIDGVKGFIGKAFETIKGLFGGGNKGGDSPTTTKKSTTSKGGSSTTKGKIPQTGDVALFSVAGVAVAAGIALVLTKKKKEDK
ncbi:MAG TPA: LPXTG cell wall anchor domain-containing protein [Candidatus Fimenecus sp.]|nr:LPXTG cell wall anchor domain-containing protein [Candidatus Fimenecus sp.]